MCLLAPAHKLGREVNFEQASFGCQYIKMHLEIMICETPIIAPCNMEDCYVMLLLCVIKMTLKSLESV